MKGPEIFRFNSNVLIFSSKPFLNRCVKKEAGKTVDMAITKTGIKNYFQEVSEDLQDCWKEILYLCLVAFVFSILIIILLQFLTSLIVWIVLFGVVLSCATGTLFLW
jgi:hypothetical protein